MGIDAKMLLILPTKPTADQIKLWSWDLCAAIGADHFFFNKDKGETAIELTGSRYRSNNDWEPGTVYEQDGAPINASPGNCLLEVHLWSRYYAVGYERGNILIICAVAEWCEANIPGVEVWYGGDSSGCIAALFPAKAREALRHHLYSSKGREYFDSWNSARFGTEVPPKCGNCVSGRGPARYGTGAAYAAFACGGCGDHIISTDNGATWERSKGEKK